ncbi:hypothetical protein [Leisingera methylohalidivorans]|uniref:Uncharacterized protein n=1 Tax=Leisingera methylohalidivorans DSM 14336 TaxID=999552 RepID=V9VSA8_9RHOB|nr:hypothetical protein [Leisingera methylohalidivorans]AHD00898.1 hypothetical protein METH_09600 [Leisingera methylohalidivorans DSM 14336]
MNTPKWLKPGIYGALAGAVMIAVAGFSWGGWVTGSSATQMASSLSHDKVIEALVPVCLDIARTDTNRVARLTEIREASSYKRREIVMAAGWATVPGSQSPDRDLAQACMGHLDLDAS